MNSRKWLTMYKIKKLKENGIPVRVYESRIKRGWDIKRAMNTPYKKKKESKYGECLDIAHKNGVLQCFYGRVNAGYTPEEASTLRTHEMMFGNKNASKNEKKEPS